MKALLSMLASLAVLATGCSKCKCDDPNPDEYISGSGLPGNWILIDLQCYCAPSPLPDERLVISATNFVEYRDGVRILDTTYSVATATLCGITPVVPALAITEKRSVPPMPAAPIKAGYTLRNDTLVLDYGSPCDAPRKTYRRVR